MGTLRTHLNRHTGWIVAIDIICLIVACFIGAALRIGDQGYVKIIAYFTNHLDGWVMFGGSIILANYLAGAYMMQNAFSRFNLFIIWAFSLFFSFTVLSITSYAWLQIALGRGVLLMSVLVYSLLSLSMKLLVFLVLFRRPGFQCRTLILGCGERALEMRRILESSHVLPVHKVSAFIDVIEDESARGSEDDLLSGVPLMHVKSAALNRMVHILDVSLIVIGFEDMKKTRELYSRLKRLRFQGVEVMMPLSVTELYSGKTPLAFINEDYLMDISLSSGAPMVYRIKRIFDIFVSLIGIIISLPILILAALMIKIESPREKIFYSQQRVGRFGAWFTIFKLRTMSSGAEESTGAIWSPADDERITALGRKLRQFRIDEIPQLFNVLKGDMSIVGPRPERPEICSELSKEIFFFDERVNIMPGITGWAQIRYPYGSSLEDARRKLEFDLFYVKHMSLILDLQIILSTLRIVLLGKERAH